MGQANQRPRHRHHKILRGLVEGWHPAGYWTTGYGALRGLNSKRVTKTSPALTKKQGEDLLRRDLAITEKAAHVLVGPKLTPNQFSACVSLVFNIGSGNFHASQIRQRRLALTERWMRDEVIEPRHHAAATQYAFCFEAAQLSGRYKVMGMERVDRSTGDNYGVMGRVVDAKHRINAAMAILGKIACDAVWSVIGEGMNLRDFVQRQAANGRPISLNEVNGRVISSVDILADHYRI